MQVSITLTAEQINEVLIAHIKQSVSALGEYEVSSLTFYMDEERSRRVDLGVVHAKLEKQEPKKNELDEFRS